MMEIVVSVVVVVIVIKLVHVFDIFSYYECHENTQKILATVGGDVETREASLLINHCRFW